jgi:hypothetical protein
MPSTEIPVCGRAPALGAWVNVSPSTEVVPEADAELVEVAVEVDVEMAVSIPVAVDVALLVFEPVGITLPLGLPGDEEPPPPGLEEPPVGETDVVGKTDVVGETEVHGAVLELGEPLGEPDDDPPPPGVDEQVVGLVDGDGLDGDDEPPDGLTDGPPSQLWVPALYEAISVSWFEKYGTWSCSVCGASSP